MSAEPNQEFEILYQESAVKDAKKLDRSVVQRIHKKILTLQSNPTGSDSIQLKGTEKPFFRIRVGDYRVIYAIDYDASIVRIARISHRSEVYDGLENL